MAAGARRKKARLSPFAVGLVFIVVSVVAIYFGFTKANPFANPYEFTATFKSANNLKPNSPVRIAGVNVGIVKEVEPLPDGSGAARVKMEVQKNGLPIHQDARLKIRPRIFLEGNFFVDIEPGSPSASRLEDGGTIPVQQTATPVQFGQVLTALDSDTRENLKIFLREYSKGLEGEGAEGFNNSIPYWEDAYRNTAIANTALLGEQPGDLHRLMRGQARTFAALSRNEEALKDLVTNFNTTAGALAREDLALQAAIPALDRLLRVGSPALASLNDALPSLRAFAREALPGVRSSTPTLQASLPFIRQLRGLVSRRELRGFSRDLRATIPSLSRLNRDTIPLLQENRALSSCQNTVLLPFAKTPIPDPSFPTNTNQPFYKQAPRGFVGLSGESRLHDANGQVFRVNFGAGPTTVAVGAGPTTAFGTALFPPIGSRPARPHRRPDHRPNVPCETQEPPDMTAPIGPANQTENPNPRNTRERRERLATAADQAREVEEHLERVERGEPSVDPLQYNEEGRRIQERQLGIDRKRGKR